MCVDHVDAAVCSGRWKPNQTHLRFDSCHSYLVEALFFHVTVGGVTWDLFAMTSTLSCMWVVDVVQASVSVLYLVFLVGMIKSPFEVASGHIIEEVLYVLSLSSILLAWLRLGGPSHRVLSHTSHLGWLYSPPSYWLG